MVEYGILNIENKLYCEVLYLRKGFSNLELSNSEVNKGYNNIFDLVINEVADKWEYFILNGIQINFEDINNKESKIIILSGESNGMTLKDGYFLIKLYCENDKESVLNVLAHEVVHVSQVYNSFRDYNNYTDYQKYKNSNYSEIMSYQEYSDNISHKNQNTEKEATLVQLFYALEQGELDICIELLEEDNEYFTFNFKTFIKKAYMFGLEKNLIIEFRNRILKTVQYVCSNYSEKDSNNYIDKRKDVLKMFKII
jgi:hypothetical protein